MTLGIGASDVSYKALPRGEVIKVIARLTGWKIIKLVHACGVASPMESFLMTDNTRSVI